MAAANGYKIYCDLYDDEKDLKLADLPPKWSHVDFCEELVYDLLLLGRARKHVDVLIEIDDATLAASLRTTCLFSFNGKFSCTTSVDKEFYFTSYDEIKAFLKENRTDSITMD